MAETKKIVFLDVVTPAMRRTLINNVPPGFEFIFAEADTEEKAIAAVPEADFVLVWSAYAPTRVVEAAKKAKLIQKIGEGTDRIDVALASRMGIPVAKTSGSNGTAVAEMATLLILAAMRWLPNAHNSIVSGKWLKFELRVGAFDLDGKQVGIIGLGKIGRKVARHMQGFGARAVYYDVVRHSESEEAEMGVRFMPLEELISTSDVISLHTPLTPSTKGMIGRRELEMMKRTAIVVNTCRGAVLDEEALYEALKEKKIRGAGVDVWTKEPADPNNPLFTLDNVVVTPHCAGGTEDAEIAGVRHAFANIVKVSRGEALDPIDMAPVPR